MIDSKFKELVHYVCDQCIENPGKLGAIKLNKILWNSDVFSYVLTGQPITPEEYIKRQFGPVPKQILRALQELESERKIQVRKITENGYSHTLYLSLTEAGAPFDADQIDLIDDVIDWIVNDHTASSISALSHNEAWEAVRIGETIPHCAVFASSPAEINENDIAWAEQVISDRIEA